MHSKLMWPDQTILPHINKSSDNHNSILNLKILRYLGKMLFAVIKSRGFAVPTKA